jgi:hypothetical protein
VNLVVAAEQRHDWLDANSAKGRLWAQSAVHEQLWAI